MVIQRTRSTRGAPFTSSNIQGLALVGLLCSPAFLVAWFLGGFDNPNPPRPIVLCQLLFLVGWFCSILAMLRLSATGQGSARYLLWVQLGGISLASTQELQDLLLPAPERAGILYRAGDAAWPLSVLFMLVVGIATARAGVFKGWRRFAPIFCGLALPLSLITAALAGRQAMGPAFGVMTTAAWGALAWAVMRSTGSIITGSSNPMEADH